MARPSSARRSGSSPTQPTTRCPRAWQRAVSLTTITSSRPSLMLMPCASEIPAMPVGRSWRRCTRRRLASRTCRRLSIVYCDTGGVKRVPSPESTYANARKLCLSSGFVCALSTASNPTPIRSRKVWSPARPMSILRMRAVPSEITRAASARDRGSPSSVAVTLPVPTGRIAIEAWVPRSPEATSITVPSPPHAATTSHPAWAASCACSRASPGPCVRR